jgi:hypothetical protein
MPSPLRLPTFVVVGAMFKGNHQLTQTIFETRRFPGSFEMRGNGETDTFRQSNSVGNSVTGRWRSRPSCSIKEDS